MRLLWAALSAVVVRLPALAQGAADPPALAAGETSLEEVTVTAKRPRSAASEQKIRATDYELRPHTTTMEILNNVPGLVVVQHQGGGKAPQYLIRGFDADHGTDFAVHVDGIPVNMVTHGHGQGYADTNFVIPESIDRLELYKGPYFAHLGDFATAGALAMITREEFDEHFVRAEGGSFGTHRYVAGASPRLGPIKTLLAAEAYFSDGPFEDPQNFSRYNLLAKATYPTASGSLSASLSIFASDWDASGQIPLRQVRAGALDRFDAIDPTEGGSTDRENLNLLYTRAVGDDGELTLHAWASRYSMSLFSNFT
ncbi:MAG TPA: Plug domain-containing protein, partial [Terriglobales bacterium]|nr:Plug domain-containing protein [Terriglobales bacterium]